MKFLKHLNFISGILLLLSLLLVSAGGVADISSSSGRILGLSKEHLWFDGLYTLVLAIFVQLTVSL